MVVDENQNKIKSTRKQHRNVLFLENMLSKRMKSEEERVATLEKTLHGNSAGIDYDDVFRKMVCQGFLTHLISIKKKEQLFIEPLVNSFSNDMMDKNFVAWLSKKLGFSYSRDLQGGIVRWTENVFQEKRGRNSISLEVQQFLYEIWIVNSIPSVDFRNGRMQ